MELTDFMTEWTPLIYTITIGDKDYAEMLIRAGVDKDRADNNGYTPLISAIECGRKQIVEILIRDGADVDKANNDGWTPLIFVIINGRKEIIEMLIRAGADMEKANENGWTPLIFASNYGHKEIIGILIREYKKKVSPFLTGLSETGNAIYLLNGFEHLQRYIISMALPIQALKEIPELF